MPLYMHSTCDMDMDMAYLACISCSKITPSGSRACTAASIRSKAGVNLKGFCMHTYQRGPAGALKSARPSWRNGCPSTAELPSGAMRDS